MMEREYEKAKEAFETYNLNSEYEIIYTNIAYYHSRYHYRRRFVLSHGRVR
jgi:hypothetical protein